MRDLLADPRIAATVAATTTGTGLGTWIDAIPELLGMVATGVGIVLSVVLIYAHVLIVRKTRLEIARLNRESASTIDDRA